MDADKLAEFAIARIRDVLADDMNYQHASLKLGGIWNWCVMAAEYQRHGDRVGSHIEVKMRPGIGARMETKPAPCCDGEAKLGPGWRAPGCVHYVSVHQPSTG